MTALAKPTAIVVFKPVPGGFVYRGPKEWLIGRTKHYFVTEAQRDAIIARSAPPTFTVMFCWMMSMVVLGSGAATTFNWVRHSYQFSEPTLGDMAILMVATLLSMLVAIKMAFRPLMNRLRPLLATLPKSEIPITGDDMKRAVKEMSSSKQLRRQAAIVSIIPASSLLQLYVQFKPGRSLMSGDPMAILHTAGVCVVGGVVILLLYQAQQKAKQERGALLG